MIYEPSRLVRYFDIDRNSEQFKERFKVYHRHYPMIARSFSDMYEYYFARDVLGEISGLIPMETRVLDCLKTSSRSAADIKHRTRMGSTVKPNCTSATALKRLEKQGLVTKKLYARGWYRWYDWRLTEAGKERVGIQ